MADIQVQLRRGTTTQHASFTGAEGEVTVDTDLDTLMVHDGSTAGGIRLAKHSELSGAGAGGTVTEVDAGTGLETSPASGITTTGTIGIANGGVGTNQLAADAVTSDKLASDAVTSAKISSTDNTFKVATTEVVINEGGADVDFRVEGDIQSNLIVTEASSDKVGINGPVNSGTGADKIPFYVNGDATSGFSIGAGGTIRIDADGAAGVTLNTTNASSPNQLAQIYNDTAGTIHFVRPQKSSNDVTHVFYADGDTESITGVYGTISDRNLKENINYLTKEQKNGQVEDIKNLRFAKYNLKGDKRTQLGVVAQDVEQTSPGLVSKAIRDGVEVRSVKQSIIHQKAVVALQVALEKIEALETRIKILESK